MTLLRYKVSSGQLIRFVRNRKMFYWEQSHNIERGRTGGYDRLISQLTGYIQKQLEITRKITLQQLCAPRTTINGDDEILRRKTSLKLEELLF